MIIYLTPEQEALIPIIRDKWRKIALDTSPTDKQKAETAINKLYTDSKRNTPEIIWFNNPLDAYLSISETYGTFYYPSYDLVTLNSPCEHMFDVVAKNLYETVEQKLHNNYCKNLTYTIYQYISPVVRDYLLEEELFYLTDKFLLSTIEVYEEAISCNYYQTIGVECFREWRLWEKLAKNYGFNVWWSLYKFAFVTPKSFVIKLDDNLKLHAEGEPALEYEKESIITGEKFRLYAYHGNILPKKYGSVLSKDWQAKWLSKETDSKLRWILAKEIGYHKLCQEFPVVEVRHWEQCSFFHGCTLVKVKSDEWGIYFLKIISCDQNKTYFCLIPHHIVSRRQAEIWVKATIYSESNLSRLCHQTNT